MALLPSWTWGELDLTEAPFAFGFGSDFGAPQTATEALAQLLQDGEIEVSTRASNRSLEFTVYVSSTDLLDAAQSEALLAAEADRERNTLTFDPGDGYGATTVFETFRAQLTFVRDDNAEGQGLRRYDVTMKAYPSSRSVDLVETPAVAASGAPTVVTINAGDAAAGWSANSTLTDSGSYLTVADASGAGPTTATYTAGAPINLTATEYVSLVMWSFTTRAPIVATSTLPGTPSLLVDGNATELVASTLVSSYQRTYYFRVAPATTATSFQFSVPSGAIGFSFNSLKRSNSILTGGSTTTRQLQRVVAVEGSARTQGSLAVEHETAALGSTLVYTWPSSERTYSPPLRPLRVTGGAVTGDTSLVSGSRDLLDTALVFDVPVASLISGAHLLMARLRSDTNGDQNVTYTAQLRQGSTNVGTATTGVVVVPFSTNPTAWRNVVLARLMLPPADVPAGSTAVVRITIVATTAAASNIDLDEAWLFNTSVGRLTSVECGTGSPAAGGSSNRLWLNAATTEIPRPTVYRGFSDDASDAVYPSPAEFASFEQHEFTPPLMNVFTVTSNALDAAVTLAHYPRWHTHAAR